MPTTETIDHLLGFSAEVAVYTAMWYMLHLAFRQALHFFIPLHRPPRSVKPPEHPRSSASPNNAAPDSNNPSVAASSEQQQQQRDDESSLKIRKKLRSHGASYIVSTIHAVLQVWRGLRHVVILFRGPIALKLYHPDNSLFPGHFSDFLSSTVVGEKYLREVDGILFSNHLLNSYLLSDLIFVLRHYPALGQMDVVLHHIAFLYCSIIGGYYQINTFSFAWLIIGEASTPLLNLRWLILTTSKTNPTRMSNALLNVTQFFFALLFFLTRICLYSLGLFYQLEILHRFPQHMPKWAIYSTQFFVVVGFLLNLAWFYKIMSRFFRRGNTKSKHQAPVQACHQDCCASSQSVATSTSTPSVDSTKKTS